MGYYDSHECDYSSLFGEDPAESGAAVVGAAGCAEVSLDAAVLEEHALYDVVLFGTATCNDVVFGAASEEELVEHSSFADQSSSSTIRAEERQYRPLALPKFGMKRRRSVSERDDEQRKAPRLEERSLALSRQLEHVIAPLTHLEHVTAPALRPEHVTASSTQLEHVTAPQAQVQLSAPQFPAQQPGNCAGKLASPAPRRGRGRPRLAPEARKQPTRYYCKYCLDRSKGNNRKSYKSGEGLRLHMGTHHQLFHPTTKLFDCEDIYCCMKFGRKADVAKHCRTKAWHTFPDKKNTLWNFSVLPPASQSELADCFAMAVDGPVANRLIVGREHIPGRGDTIVIDDDGVDGEAAMAPAAAVQVPALAWTSYPVTSNGQSAAVHRPAGMAPLAPRREADMRQAEYAQLPLPPMQLPMRTAQAPFVAGSTYVDQQQRPLDVEQTSAMPYMPPDTINPALLSITEYPTGFAAEVLPQAELTTAVAHSKSVGMQLQDHWASQPSQGLDYGWDLFDFEWDQSCGDIDVWHC